MVTFTPTTAPSLRVPSDDGDVEMDANPQQQTDKRVQQAAQLPALPPTPRGFAHSPQDLTQIPSPQDERQLSFSDRMDTATPQTIQFVQPSPPLSFVLSGGEKRKFTFQEAVAKTPRQRKIDDFKPD